MSLIDVSALTFGYDGSFDNVFENVSFQLDTRWKLGFVGRNGRGKTTFLKLLLGQYQYTGKIAASVQFSYFPFDVPNPAKPTIEIVADICPDCEDWQLQRECNLLGLNPEILTRPFATLSGGEQTKILLVALFLRPNQFLLIDEPTNHLDTQARQLVGRYLASKDGFILVSHDRAFLDSAVDHILSINKQDIQVQGGNFSTWYNNKQLEDNFERAENAKLRGEIKKLDAAARRTADWSDQVEKTKYGQRDSGLRPDRGYIGHKAAKTMARSKAIAGRREAAKDTKEQLLKNIEDAQPLTIACAPYHSKQLLAMQDVAIAYGQRQVCKGISLTVQQRDRIAITGVNGCGKSSLLKLILGQDIPHTGLCQVGGGLKISYVSQESAHLTGNLRDYACQHKLDESRFKTILRKLDFSRIQLEKNMQDFSMGQKKKVLLAHSLTEDAHLYIWDEPLNYIDVLSRMQIEEAILAHNPTMLFVEHDSVFTDNIATKRLAIL